MSRDRRRIFRLDEWEDEALREAVEKHGADISDFLRAAVQRAIIDQPGPTPQQLEEYCKLAQVLRGAAYNINTYVRLANQANISGAPIPELERLTQYARGITKDADQIISVVRKWGV